MAAMRVAPPSRACHPQIPRHSHHHDVAFLRQQHFTMHRYFSILRNCTASSGRLLASCLFHVEWLNFFFDTIATQFPYPPLVASTWVLASTWIFTSATIFVTTTTLPARIRLASLGYIHGIYPQNKTYPSSRYFTVLI